jgi:hypothetical protein
MSLFRSLTQRWTLLRGAARREFLRDPDVVLFERQAEPRREGAHGR